MRVLLDANLPQDFRHEFVGHEVQTARFAGLSHADDGVLLDRMAGRFDALVTMDASLPYQQNMADRPFAIIVLRANSNRIADLRPLVPALLRALATVKSGQVREIG